MTDLKLDTAPRRDASDFDPYDETSLRDPHDWHALIREAGPIVWLKKYEIWATGRFETVRRVMGDWETFISSAGVGIEDIRANNSWIEPGLLLRVDPPAHTKAKRIMQRILSVRNVAALRESFLAEARALVDRLVEKGSFDAVADCAVPFPLKVFPDAVGISNEGRENLLPWGDMSFNAQGPRNDIFLRSAAEVEKVKDWIYRNCQREALAPGGFGMEIYEAVDAGELVAREAWLLVRGLLTAGLDTTVHTIGLALHYLAANPDEFRKLRDNPALARGAFEEALRLNSTVQNFFRTTSRDVTIEGVELKKDQKVLLLLGSANRDPRHWEAPDEYRIDRKVAGHVGFGHGVHQCVGQMIARLEGECMLTAVAEKVGSLRPAGPVAYHLNNAVRGLERAPMVAEGR